MWIHPFSRRLQFGYMNPWGSSCTETLRGWREPDVTLHCYWMTSEVNTLSWCDASSVDLNRDSGGCFGNVTSWQCVGASGVDLSAGSAAPLGGWRWVSTVSAADVLVQQRSCEGNDDLSCRGCQSSAGLYRLDLLWLNAVSCVTECRWTGVKMTESRRSFHSLFPFTWFRLTSGCFSLFDEILNLFLSHVNNIFIFVCWHEVSHSSFDIIYSAMLCMTHCENAHRLFYVAASQFNLKYQIQINQ